MHYLNYTVSLEPLIAVIVGVFNYQQPRDKLSKPFLVYLFLLTILEITALYLSINYINNHIIYNILDICTALLFLYLFWVERNKLFWLIFILILIFSIGNLLVNDPLIYKEKNYFLIYLFVGIASILFISISNSSNLPISIDSFRFWFYAGFIIISFSTLNLSILFPRIMVLNHSNILAKYFSFFNFIASTLQYLCFSIAFLCKK
jgi:hypothetical protein